MAGPGEPVIHHVQLSAPAASESIARAFWSDVLGLEEIEKPAELAARGGCWFRGHGIEIHVGTEDEFLPARRAHPGFRVQDIDAWAARLQRVGHEVRWDDLFPGMRLPGHAPLLHGRSVWHRLEFLEPTDVEGGHLAGTLRGL